MRLILPVLLLLSLISSYGQVGVNTQTPNAMLEIKASNETSPASTDGLIIPRLVTNPSDLKLKEGVLPTDRMTDKLMALEVRDYNFKRSYSEEFGFPRESNGIHRPGVGEGFSSFGQGRNPAAGRRQGIPVQQGRELHRTSADFDQSIAGTKRGNTEVEGRT